ncbi:MAG: shikimate dehydrogenase [Chloroflexota bacterium]|nr:shikimate dehydrogenase [Chloroflexota bacterium]
MSTSPQTVYKFSFIGVSTGASAMTKIFPHWMAALGRPDVVLEGIDCQIHDDPARYRQIVSAIKEDPQALGGLITTHKLDLLTAARDLFDTLDPYAQLTDEISCIAKQEGRLAGYAVDPIADGRALHAIIGDNHFGRTKGAVLCLGAGGAATAIVLHLLNQRKVADRPKYVTLVDVEQARLDHIQAMVQKVGTDIHFEYLCQADPAANDQLLTTLTPGSVVINATGLGKDLPGSPITETAKFPKHSVVWELNYRGERPFLQQALAQQKSRKLTVEDGWVAFLHGWTGVISHVLSITIDPARFAQLAKIAAQMR